MATVPHSSLDSLKRWHKADAHPVWKKMFSEAEQKSLADEDLSAGYCVSAVLMAAVVMGFVLISFSVWVAL